MRITARKHCKLKRHLLSDHPSISFIHSLQINTNRKLFSYISTRKYTNRTIYHSYQPFLSSCFGITLHQKTNSMIYETNLSYSNRYFLDSTEFLHTAYPGSQRLSDSKIDTIVSADKQTFLQFPGKVKAAQDISLAFRVSGTISKIHVKDGTRVQEGQLLAELDPTDYQVQLDATEAEYQQIKAEAERVMALYKDNGTTPNANDKAVYGLKQITAKYKHHKDQLAYTRLYAPFNGYVQKRLFEAHETIGAGMPVLSMISSGTPEVEINLPAAEYIRRDQFDNYHCTFDIYPGETYPLKLISVTPKANANQLYTMRLQVVPGTPAVPSPGMNTMVTISYRTEQTNTLSVPTGAILQKKAKRMYSSSTHRTTQCTNRKYPCYVY